MNISNERSISERLYQLNNFQQNYIHNRLKAIGLNEYQSRTISYIDQHVGTMQKNLALYLGKSDATLTNILKALEQKEYIYRIVPQGNERLKLLYLSEEGKKIAQYIRTIFIDLERVIDEHLDDDERTSLFDITTKIQDNLKKSI